MLCYNEIPLFHSIVFGLPWSPDPPDRPQNISCTYKIRKNDSGDVVCTWDRGQDTYLWNTSMLLWVTNIFNEVIILPINNIITDNVQVYSVNWSLNCCVSGWELCLETTQSRTMCTVRELGCCHLVWLCPDLSSLSQCGFKPKILWAL